MTTPARGTCADYRHFLPITTRWMDNNVYCHVNNVVYYSYFDTMVHEYLIRRDALDIHDGNVIGLVVESACRYMASLAFPEPVTAGWLGNSAVAYEIALFDGATDLAATESWFVHVYVDTIRGPSAPRGISSRRVSA